MDPRNAVISHLVENVAATAVSREPFPHLVVDDFLPADVFRRLVGTIPALDCYERPERGVGTAERGERAILPLSHIAQAGRPGLDVEFLAWLNGLLGDAEVHNCLISAAKPDDEPLRTDSASTYRSQVILSRDLPPYEIGPHTDIPKRILSMIVYLAPGIHAGQLGTTLFSPDDDSFSCGKGIHYGFNGFRAVKTVVFRPNRALIFARSDHSFHGLLPVHARQPARDALLYEITYSTDA